MAGRVILRKPSGKSAARFPRRDAIVLPLRLGHLAEPVFGGLLDHALGEVRRRNSPGIGRESPKT